MKRPARAIVRVILGLLLSPSLLAQQPDDAQPAQAPETTDVITLVQQLRTEVERLSAQVDRLSDEVKGLQASGTPVPTPARPKNSKPVAAPVAVAPAPAPIVPPDENNPITVLVFRDGKPVETRNYAIVGESVWVYTEQESKKYRLADLDVEATKRVNSDRGVSFQLPPTR